MHSHTALRLLGNVCLQERFQVVPKRCSGEKALTRNNRVDAKEEKQT